MKNLWFAAALVCAVSVSAQVTPSPDDGLPGAFSAALKSARAQSAKLAPAPVDPKPVEELFTRLSKDGAHVETRDRVEDAYDRIGVPDKKGRFQNLHVGVVEASDPDEAAPGRLVLRDLVLRRFYSTLEAQSEEWTVGKDGSGRFDIWHFSVAVDGRLLSVVRESAPLEPTPDGKSVLHVSKISSKMMSPSDKSVQKRWKALTKQLLTLGPTAAI
jgi:hypothetical protein